MSTRKIDGMLFEQMMRNGLNNLAAQEKTINALNVFPVADGDTGTNMRLTLESGIRCARPTKLLCDYLKALSSGMLLGARGNSGVILSQLFKGIYLELSRNSAAAPVEMRNAFIRGYKVAYESVIRPVEGTILTVAREGIEQTVRQMRHPADLETLLEAYLSSMSISLAATPDVLPVLKEMGVVDSGAKGYIAIVEGMYRWLKGEIFDQHPDSHSLDAPPQADLSLFDENSRFDQGYCMEFILQLMRDPQYMAPFLQADFIRALEQRGNSLVVVQDGSRVKVHVHTKKPASVIEYAQQYGEFLTFKLENMQLQHNEYLRDQQAAPAASADTQPAPAPKPHKALSVIAAVNGEGNRQTFTDLGCDFVIDGGATMNASSEDFLNAIRQADADAVVILPDNANMLLAARQAVELSGNTNAKVLEAKTLAEGYYALAMDVPDSKDIDMRVAQMNSGIESIETLLITAAARAWEHNGVKCEENECIALYRDEVIVHSRQPLDTVIRALQRVEGIEDRESCVFFRGKGGNVQLEQEIERRVGELFPMMECSFLDGGQEIYDWIIGIM